MTLDIAPGLNDFKGEELRAGFFFMLHIGLLKLSVSVLRAASASLVRPDDFLLTRLLLLFFLIFVPMSS